MAPYGFLDMSFMAFSSWFLQSHLSEPNTSPVRQELWMRTGTSLFPRTSPFTSAACSFPLLPTRKAHTLNLPCLVGSLACANSISNVPPRAAKQSVGREHRPFRVIPCARLCLLPAY